MFAWLHPRLTINWKWYSFFLLRCSFTENHHSKINWDGYVKWAGRQCQISTILLTVVPRFGYLDLLLRLLI